MNDLVTYVRARIVTMTKSERGASAVEYGLLVALIAIAIIVGGQPPGGSLNGIFNKTASSIDDAPADRQPLQRSAAMSADVAADQPLRGAVIMRRRHRRAAPRRAWGQLGGVRPPRRPDRRDDHRRGDRSSARQRQGLFQKTCDVARPRAEPDLLPGSSSPASRRATSCPGPRHRGLADSRRRPAPVNQCASASATDPAEVGSTTSPGAARASPEPRPTRRSPPADRTPGPRGTRSPRPRPPGPVAWCGTASRTRRPRRCTPARPPRRHRR